MLLRKHFIWHRLEDPGPCWLDIPLNVQGATVETDELEGFDPSKENLTAIPSVTNEQADAIIEKIRQAKRPVLNAGNGNTYCRSI